MYIWGLNLYMSLGHSRIGVEIELERFENMDPDSDPILFCIFVVSSGKPDVFCAAPDQSLDFLSHISNILQKIPFFAFYIIYIHVHINNYCKQISSSTDPVAQSVTRTQAA